jgi:hypothetical protein
MLHDPATPECRSWKRPPLRYPPPSPSHTYAFPGGTTGSEVPDPPNPWAELRLHGRFCATLWPRRFWL